MPAGKQLRQYSPATKLQSFAPSGARYSIYKFPEYCCGDGWHDAPRHQAERFTDKRTMRTRKYSESGTCNKTRHMRHMGYRNHIAVAYHQQCRHIDGCQLFVGPVAESQASCPVFVKHINQSLLIGVYRQVGIFQRLRHIGKRNLFQAFEKAGHHTASFIVTGDHHDLLNTVSIMHGDLQSSAGAIAEAYKDRLIHAEVIKQGQYIGRS